MVQPSSNRNLLPLIAGTVDPETESLCHSLENRLEEIAEAMNASSNLMEAIRSYIAATVEDEDIRLLRLYESFLSWEHKPRIIRMTVLGLSGMVSSQYDWRSIPDSAYEEVTLDRLEACRRVYHEKKLMGLTSRFPLAREAARNPEITDRILELAHRGYEDYQCIMDRVRSDDYWVTAASLQSGVL